MMKSRLKKSVVVLTLLTLSLSIFCGWSGVTSSVESVSEKGDMDVQKFELDIQFLNHDRLKMNYRKQNDRVYAKVERKTSQGKIKMTKNEAQQEMENVLQHLELTSEMSVSEVVYSTLDTLQINKQDIKEYEVEVQFTDGKKVEIEFAE